MRSVLAATDDRTARARIREAAITCFADDGVEATSIRAIAATAGVSPALVIHHFGTKDALRHTCDEHVAAIIRTQKSEAMASGQGFDPLAALRRAQHDLPLFLYLARTLTDGAPQVSALVDELVADADGYLAEGVRAGLLRPTSFPYERAALLTLWSLGALVLHEHLERLLGVDLTRSPAELADTPEGAAYFGAALELFTDGLMSEQVAASIRESLGREAEPAASDKEAMS